MSYSSVSYTKYFQVVKWIRFIESLNPKLLHNWVTFRPATWLEWSLNFWQVREWFSLVFSPVFLSAPLIHGRVSVLDYNWGFLVSDLLATIIQKNDWLKSSPFGTHHRFGQVCLEQLGLLARGSLFRAWWDNYPRSAIWFLDINKQIRNLLSK